MNTLVDDKVSGTRSRSVLKYLRAWWLKSHDCPNPIVRVLEMLVFASAVPMAGFWLFPENPLGLDSGFAWSAAGPIVFAARYGSGWGLGCALSATCVIAVQGILPGAAPSIEVQLTLGTVIVSIIVGDVATAWRKRTMQAEARHAAVTERLERFAVDYHLLKVSHGQLERYLAGQRGSLRQAMQELQCLTRADAPEKTTGESLLAMFAQFCSVQVAGLYRVRTDKTLHESPMAVLGDMGTLPMFDPLLRQTIASGDVASIKQSALSRDNYSPELLAVVPIKDVHGQLYCVLAIRDMHFIAFQQQNLNIMALLGICIGNTLTHKDSVNGEDPTSFITGLETALHIAHQQSLESSLLCFQLRGSAQAKSLMDHARDSVRSLDWVWSSRNAHGILCLCILMPLTDEGECKLFVERLIDSADKTLSLDMQEYLLDMQSMQIGPSDSESSCVAFITHNFGVDIFDRSVSSSDQSDGGQVA